MATSCTVLALAMTQRFIVAAMEWECGRLGKAGRVVNYILVQSPAPSKAAAAR